MTIKIIQPSVISKEKFGYIKAKLVEFEAQNDITIVHAIESGSRAWGFPSLDSDYDVRFIYVRPQCDYLSVEIKKDTLESPIIMDDFLNVPYDLSGWDFRKALQLMLKSNAVIYEWISSPVCYLSDERFLQEFKKLYLSAVNLNAIAYHYYAIVSQLSKKILSNDEYISIKSYLYIIRPCLCLSYINQNKIVPPMDLYSLHKKIDLDVSFVTHLAELIEMKKSVNETSKVKRVAAIDAYIKSQLNSPVQRCKPVYFEANFIKEANCFFQRYLCK